MESNNEEEVERQKLVEEQQEEEEIEKITNLPPTPQNQTISPVLSSKVFSSGETSTNSIGKSNPDSARLIYVNERSKHQESKPKPRKIQRDPLVAEQHNPNISYSFAARALKHHSFISEVPDVRHMEQALLGLLEDFHSGKLKAFGLSGCTMEQMTDIREQQERLAKLHFELGNASDSINNGSANINAQENMSQLVEKLEQLSVSIEKLHASNSEI